MLTENLVLVRAIGAILVSIAQEVGAGAIAVRALELAELAEALWAKDWFVRAIRAVSLPVAFPPDRNTLFIVGTQELGAGAPGQAEVDVTQMEGLEVIWTLTGESISSCLDEAEMRTATIVGTTGIVHNWLPVWMIHMDVEWFMCRVHQHNPM